jgi:hypothetical protein
VILPDFLFARTASDAHLHFHVDRKSPGERPDAQDKHDTTGFFRRALRHSQHTLTLPTLPTARLFYIQLAPAKLWRKGCRVARDVVPWSLSSPSSFSSACPVLSQTAAFVTRISCLDLTLSVSLGRTAQAQRVKGCSVSHSYKAPFTATSLSGALATGTARTARQAHPELDPLELSILSHTPASSTPCHKERGEGLAQGSVGSPYSFRFAVTSPYGRRGKPTWCPSRVLRTETHRRRGTGVWVNAKAPHSRTSTLFRSAAAFLYAAQHATSTEGGALRYGRIGSDVASRLLPSTTLPRPP